MNNLSHFHNKVFFFFFLSNLDNWSLHLSLFSFSLSPLIVPFFISPTLRMIPTSFLPFSLLPSLPVSMIPSLSLPHGFSSPFMNHLSVSNSHCFHSLSRLPSFFPSILPFPSWMIPSSLLSLSKWMSIYRMSRVWQWQCTQHLQC